MSCEAELACARASSPRIAAMSKPTSPTAVSRPFMCVRLPHNYSCLWKHGTSCLRAEQSVGGKCCLSRRGWREARSPRQDGLLGRGTGRGEVEIGDHHAGAGAGKSPGNLLADAAGGSGYEGDFVFG